MPFGCGGDFELSRMRVESMQEAATITTRAFSVRSAPVTRSKYWTPLAFPSSLTSTRATTALSITRSLPVCHRRLDQIVTGVKKCANVAPAAAGAAIVTFCVPVMRLGQNGASAGDDRHADRPAALSATAFRRSGAGAPAACRDCRAANPDRPLPPQTPMN